MRRATTRALQGLALAVGAPLGWLFIEVVRGTSVRAALTGQWSLYLYMLVATAAAFGLFGLILGDREERLILANRRLEDLTVTDALTGLRNARYFHARLAEERAEAERTHRPLAVVVLDLDFFKRVNDRYGHPVGDEVLAKAAKAVSSITRQGETEARLGGEEFALLLPDSTAGEALEVAERVRRAIQATGTSVGGGEVVRITASAGVASTAELPGAGTQELLRAADDALFRAKREGRNRTVVAGATG